MFTKYLSMDVVAEADDYGTQQSQLISHECFKNLFEPRLRDLTGFIRDLLDKAYAYFGIFPTLLERDFNIPPLADMLKEVAVNYLANQGDEVSLRVAVKPSVIVEVACEEIQSSTKYAAGYALRFPRIIRLRDDKPLSEVSSLTLVSQLFLSQRARQS